MLARREALPLLSAPQPLERHLSAVALVVPTRALGQGGLPVVVALAQVVAPQPPDPGRHLSALSHRLLSHLGLLCQHSSSGSRTGALRRRFCFCFCWPAAAACFGCAARCGQSAAVSAGPSSLAAVLARALGSLTRDSLALGLALGQQRHQPPSRPPAVGQAAAPVGVLVLPSGLIW